MSDTAYDDLFASIRELVMRHSPSGVEDEVDSLLQERFAQIGIPLHRDSAGNLVARIAGRGSGKIAITAHKDEIGAIVTAIEADGRLKIRKLGGAFPWIYGEGVVDVLGDRSCVSGILSFGSRHVSHASPQHAQQKAEPVRWFDSWIETKLETRDLIEAGVRPGSRVVIGKHRKAPYRLGDFIASYALDNKAGLAVLLELAKRLKDTVPDVYLVASAKEEIGAVGAMYFTQRQSLDAVIALEIAPVAPEYPVKEGPAPVLVVEDAFGLYDDGLNALITRVAGRLDISLQLAALNGFGSDASIAAKYGHVARATCLGFPAQNTHGYEIAHLGAMANCVEILSALCGERFDV